MYTSINDTATQPSSTKSHPRLRIALISAAYYPAPGGISVQLSAIAPALQALGFDVHIVTKAEANLPAQEKIKDVTVHRLSVAGPRPLASLKFVIKALRCLRQLQPDIIHAHELFLPTTTALAAKVITRARVIASAHAGGPLLGEVARLKNARFSALRLTLLRHTVDQFVAISPLIDKEMAAVAIPIRQRTVIPNGIDMTRFTPLSLEQQAALRQRLQVHGQPLLIFTGRLASEKRVHHLLQIWPTVRAHYPEAQLLIVGDGPEQAALSPMATAGVRFVGQVEDVTPYLQAADLFVLPSVSEGFSLSTLEALASALPVIATAVGAIPDFITSGDNGWIVPIDDVDALQEAILRALANPSQRRACGQRGRALVIDQYALPVVVDQLGAFYRQLANPSKQGNEDEAS